MLQQLDDVADLVVVVRPTRSMNPHAKSLL